MKRYFHRNPDKVVHITIEVDLAQRDIAASEEFRPLTHPSIKRKFKKSDEWLKEVNDLAGSIIGSMKGRKFNIIDAYPSKKSYTYYIIFQPADKNGDLWDTEMMIQIELRDHTSRTHAESGQLSEDILVKAYYLEDKRYKGMYSLMKEIWRDLTKLQEGDFEAFFDD